MEISPWDIAKLIVFALLFGVACGVLNDVNRLVRTAFGEIKEEYRTKLYNKKIPVLKKCIKPIRIKSGGGRIAMAFMIALQDIFLFFFAGVGATVLSFYFNMGRARMYSVIAIFIGFLLYYFTVGRMSVRVFDTVFFVCRAICLIVFKIILTPLYIIGRFLWKNIKKPCKKTYKSIAKKIKVLYNNIMKKNNAASVEDVVKKEGSK